MNPLFFDVLVVILLFLVVFVCCWVHVVKERVSREARIVEAHAKSVSELWTQVAAIEQNLPKVKLMELQELFGALKSEFDGVLVENDAFRQKCTNQMQRFDSIMRRTKALVQSKGPTLPPGPGDIPDLDDEDAPLPQRFLSENPNALAAEAATGPVSASNAREEARAAMRMKWKANRGL